MTSSQSDQDFIYDCEDVQTKITDIIQSREYSARTVITVLSDLTRQLAISAVDQDTRKQALAEVIEFYSGLRQIYE